MAGNLVTNQINNSRKEFPAEMRTISASLDSVDFKEFYFTWKQERMGKQLRLKEVFLNFLYKILLLDSD